MKKHAKKNLIFALSMIFAASLGVASVAKNTFSASADTVSTVGNFEMQDGAAIRIKDDAPSGIRWSVNVTEAYYNYASALSSSVEFGVLVDNVAVQSVESNATEVAIPRWKVVENERPIFNKDGVWTYNASITYDKLVADLTAKNYEETEIEEALTKAYAQELYARAYVKYVDGEGNEKYEYSETADVNRSIKGVAMDCLIQENATEEGDADVTTDNKASFIQYAGGEYATIKSETVVKNAYDLTNATGTITSQAELEAGDYAVYVGAKKISDKLTHAGGKISATVAGLGSTIAVKGEENNVRFINEDGEVYQVPFVSATHLISTFDGLKSYLDYAVTEDAKNSYAVLTTNIEGNSNSLTGRGASECYYGTLDGLGYSISDVVVTSRSGVFGGYILGTIKNVAFDNLTTTNTSTDSNHGLLGIYLNSSAIVNNVYVKATVSPITMYRGLFRYNNPACQVSNIVADITYSDDNSATTTYVYGDSANDGWDAWYGNQLYAIGNADKQGGAGNNPVYATSEAFFNAEKANITAEKGFNDYWSKDGYSLSFGDTVIATAAKETKDAWYKTADFDVNLSSLLDGDTPEKLYVNGVETTIASNVYTVDWDTQTLGEVSEIEVWGNGKIVVQPYMAVTHAISTANDFQTFRNYTQTTTFATTAAYAVLLNDIYYSDCTVTDTDLGETNTGFYGIFNGLGHTIYNWTVSCAGGVFGAIRGDATEIKNVAFVNLKNTRGTSTGNAGLLGGYIYRGIFSNVYVKGSFTSTHNNFGVFSRGNNRNFTNCIFDITYPTDSTYNAFGFNIGTVTNVYLIGNAKQLAANNTTTPYATASACVSAIGQTLANVSANDYWTMQNNELYFGNTKVE